MFLRWSMRITKGIAYLFTNLLSFLIGYLLAKEFQRHKDKQQQLMWQYESCPQKVTALCNVIRISCFTRDSETKLEFYFYICVSKDSSFIFTNNCSDHLKPSHEWDKRNPFPNPVEQKDYFQDGRSLSLSSENEPVTSHLFKKDFSQLSTIVRHKVPLPFITSRKDLSGTFLKELYRPPEPPLHSEAPLQKCFNVGETVLSLEYLRLLTNLCKRCACVCYETVKELCSQHSHFKHNFNHTINTFLKELKNSVGAEVSNEIISKERIIIKECCSNTRVYLEYEIVPEEETNTTLDIFFGNSDDKTSHRNVMKSKLELNSDLESSKIKVMRFMKDYENFPRKQAQSSRIHLKNVSSKEDLEIPYDFANYNISSKKVHSNNSVNSFKQNVLLRNVRNLSNTSPEARISTSETLNLNLISKDLMENEAFKKSKMDLNSIVDSSEHNLNSTDHINDYENSMINEREYFEVSSSSTILRSEEESEKGKPRSDVTETNSQTSEKGEEQPSETEIVEYDIYTDEEKPFTAKKYPLDEPRNTNINNNDKHKDEIKDVFSLQTERNFKNLAADPEELQKTTYLNLIDLNRVVVSTQKANIDVLETGKKFSTAADENYYYTTDNLDRSEHLQTIISKETLVVPTEENLFITQPDFKDFSKQVSDTAQTDKTEHTDSNFIFFPSMEQTNAQTVQYKSKFPFQTLSETNYEEYGKTLGQEDRIRNDQKFIETTHTQSIELSDLNSEPSTLFEMQKNELETTLKAQINFVDLILNSDSKIDNFDNDQFENRFKSEITFTDIFNPEGTLDLETVSINFDAENDEQSTLVKNLNDKLTTTGNSKFEILDLNFENTKHSTAGEMLKSTSNSVSETRNLNSKVVEEPTTTARVTNTELENSKSTAEVLIEGKSVKMEYFTSIETNNDAFRGDKTTINSELSFTNLNSENVEFSALDKAYDHELKNIVSSGTRGDTEIQNKDSSTSVIMDNDVFRSSKAKTNEEESTFNSITEFVKFYSKEAAEPSIQNNIVVDKLDNTFTSATFFDYLASQNSDFSTITEINEDELESTVNSKISAIVTNSKNNTEKDRIDRVEIKTPQNSITGFIDLVSENYNYSIASKAYDSELRTINNSEASSIDFNENNQSTTFEIENNSSKPSQNPESIFLNFQPERTELTSIVKTQDDKSDGYYTENKMNEDETKNTFNSVTEFLKLNPKIAEYSTVVKINDDDLDSVQTSEREFVDLNLPGEGYSTIISISNDKGKSTGNTKSGNVVPDSENFVTRIDKTNNEELRTHLDLVTDFIDLTSKNNSLAVNKIDNELKTHSNSEMPSIDENSDENKQLKTIETNDDDFKTNISFENGLNDLSSENPDPSASLNVVNDDLNITNSPTDFTYFQNIYSGDSKTEHLSEANRVTSTKTDNNIYLEKEKSTLSHDKNFNYVSTIDEFPTNVLTDVQSATKESNNANDISSVRAERDIRINTNDVLDLNEQITVVTTNIPFLTTFFNSDDSKREHLSETNRVTSRKTDNNIYLEKEESTLSPDKNFNYVSTIDQFPTNVLTDVQSATKESKNVNDISSVRTERDIRINPNDGLNLNDQITVVTTNFPFLVTFSYSDDSKIEHMSETNRVTSTKSDNNIYLEKEESTLSHDQNFNYVSTIDEFPTNVLTDVQSATKESKNANDISSVRTERDIRINTNDVLDLNDQIAVVTTYFPFLVTFFNSDDSKIEHLSEANRVTSTKIDNNIYLEKEESTFSHDKNLNYVSTIDEFPTNVLTDVQSATKESTNANDISSVRTERDIRLNTNDGLDLNDQVTVVTTNFPFLVTFFNSDDSKIEHLSEANRVTSRKTDNNIYLEKEESTISHDKNFNYVSTIDQFPTNVLTDVQSATKESKNANDISSVRTERDIRINTNDVLDLNDQITVVTTNFPFLVTFFNSDDSKIEHLSEANRVTSTKTDNNIYLEKEESTLSHDQNFNYVSTIDEFPTNVLTDVQSPTKESKNANDISSVRTERDIWINTNDVLDLNDQIAVVTTNFPFLVTFFNSDDSKVEHLSEANRVTSTKTYNNIYLEKEESTLSHDKNFNYASTVDEFPTKVITDVQSATKESKNANDISSVRTERDIRVNTNDVLDLNDKITVVTTNFPFLVTFFSSDDSKIDHDGPKETEMKVSLDDTKTYPDSQGDFEDVTKLQKTLSTEELSSLIADKNVGLSTSNNPRTFSIEIDTDSSRNSKQGLEDFDDINEEATFTVKNYVSPASLSSTNKFTSPSVKNEFFTKKEFIEPPATDIIQPSSELSSSDFQTKEIDTDSSKNSNQGLEDFGGINFNGEAKFTTKNNVFPTFLSSTNQFTSPSVKIESLTKEDLVPESSEFSFIEFQTKEMEEDFYSSNTFETKGESSFSSKNPLTDESLSSTVISTPFSYSTLDRPRISIKVTTPELSEITLNDKVSTPNFGVTKNVLKGELSPSVPKGNEDFTKNELSSTITNQITNIVDKIDTDFKTSFSVVNQVSGSNSASTESSKEIFATNKKIDFADGIPTTEILKLDEYTSEGSINNPKTNSINQYDITPYPFTSISTTVSSTMKEAVLNNNDDITENYVPVAVQTDSKINSEKEIFSKDIAVTDQIEAKNSVGNTQFYVTNENNIIISPDTTIVSAESEIISHTTKLFLQSSEKYSSAINRDEDSTTSLNLNSPETNDRKEVSSSDNVVITGESDRTVSVTVTPQFYPINDDNRQTSSDATTLDVRSEVISFTSKVFTQSSEKYSSVSSPDKEITTTLNFLTPPKSNDEKPYSKDIITQYVSERNLDSFTSFTDKTVNLKSTISPSTEDKMSTILPEKKIQVATENTSPKTDSMLLPKEENTNFFAKDLITELNEKDLITESTEEDLITELNDQDLFPVLETDISTEIEDSVSEEILIRTDRDISFPVDENIAIPSYKTENPPTRDEDKTNSVEETSQSSAGYDALTDESEINISEFDGLVTTEEQVITNNEVRIQPTEDFPLKEIDITDKNEETTFLGKELIRTEREILSSSQVSGLESSVPDIEQEKSSVDGASNLPLGGNIGISVNADISTELNFKTSSKNFPVSTDQDANTVQETTEKTSVEVVEIETSTKNLGETSSTDLPKTLPKTSATPSTDLPKTFPKTSATPLTDLPKTLPKTSATPSTKEKTDDTIPTTEGKEINTIQNVFLSTTVPKSSTEEKKVSETVTSENQRVSSTAQETTVRSTQISEMSSSTIASTSSSTSLSTSSSTSTSKTLTSTSKTLTSTSKKTEVSSSSRVEMVSPSPNADKTTASASESSTIPFHFTIDANYDEIVGRRKKEFEDSLASQLVVVMRIPSQCLKNLKVSKGSIEVNFDLSPNSEYGHMADEKALKAAAEELKRMIDNGQLNLNDLNGNTMVIIPIDPPTKAPLVNQTEHTTIILGVVISVFIITVITVAVAAIIIKRKNNMTQRLSPIEEMRSKMPSYREIPFQEALFMKGPAKNKLMLGKYCYDTGKWMGPGPEPVPYQPPESAVYRPPTDTEIRQTPRPPTSVFDSPERNISDHGHMISMDLRHQRSEPSRSDAVNRLKKRERKIKNRLGT